MIRLLIVAFALIGSIALFVAIVAALLASKSKSVPDIAVNGILVAAGCFLVAATLIGLSRVFFGA